MAEKQYEENIHQMIPLLIPTYNYTVGLDCLRIKQIPSLSEGKSFEGLN
jgi:hypothetical protein